MRFILNKLLHGKYLNANLILSIDVITSTIASSVAIIAIGAIINYYVLPRTEILIYTAIAFIASIIFLYISKAHQSIIRHMKLRGIARFIGAILGKILILGMYLFFFSKLNSTQTIACLVADFFLTLFLLLSFRVLSQIVYDYIRTNTKERRLTERVLIYGVGDKAASLVTRLQNSPHYRIVGFLTYSKAKKKLSIEDNPVFSFSSINDLAHLIDKANVGTIIFAHRADARIEENRLIKYCKQNNFTVLYAPSIDDISSDYTKVREINIEDLLERPAIELSMKDIITNFKGKTVLVTGAAGSIGSELCRQLANIGAGHIIMFDSAETPMHNLRTLILRKLPSLVM